MNAFYLFEKDEKKPSFYIINDSKRIEHLNQILKATPGDHLIVCLINQGLAKAQLMEISKNKAALQVIEKINNGVKPFVELWTGLCRPPTVKKLLEHGTSLGIQSFNFYQAELSEKSYSQSKIYESDSLEELMALGLSQSRLYYQMPQVHVTTLPQLLGKPHPQNNRFLLCTNTKKTFQDYPIDFGRPIQLAFGPERGLTAMEEESFLSHGFLPISLGQSTLRVEIATFAALGQLHLLKDQNSSL